MPWKEVCAMEERVRFVLEAAKKELSLSELCRQFGVSRVTGYKWLERYRSSGMEGLREQSRAPRQHPNAVEEEVMARLVALRERYPSWGPKKLQAWWAAHEPERRCPAQSTIGEMLHALGMSRPRKRNRRPGAVPPPGPVYDAPNAVWCVDFKGRFVTGDGRRCEPLTITDGYSRFLLRCQALDNTTYAKVRPYFEHTFREYGLPWTILSDNGVPFAASNPLRLSRLNVWWMKLGIHPLRTRPAHPQENGRHERFHLTLKQETAQPPQATLRRQQARFEQFRQYYNHERPHEALGQTAPAQRYESSPRAFPSRLSPMEYDVDWTRRRVYLNGCIWWTGQLIFISAALADEYVALQALPVEPFYTIRFGNEVIAFLDERKKKILAKLPNAAKNALAQQTQSQGKTEE
jgi:putative transposase